MRIVFGLLALAVAASTALAAEPRRPALRLADPDPVTLAGSRFAAGEKVRVSATVAGTTRMRIVRATRSGTFRVVFSSLAAPNACSVTASAVGRSGAKAVYRLSERMCPLDGASPSGERVP